MVRVIPSAGSAFARASLLAAAAMAATACAGIPSDGPNATTEDLTGTISLWADTVLPATTSVDDTAAVELGVKIRVDVAGSITSLRFYKGRGNTGTHVGHLWTGSGTLLASATFTGETASGWQTVRFASPVTVRPGTTYVASYHTTTGHYADDENAFASHGVDHGPLHALRDGADGVDGVYRYGASAFPTDGWRASNYWVDVVFAPTATDAGTPTDATAPHDASPATDATGPHDASTDATTPPLSRWPNASNTGVPAGTTLTPYTGPQTITAAGTVIDGKDITDTLVVEAAGVVIRRSRMHHGAYFAVRVVSGSVRVEDSDISGMESDGIVGSDWTGLRLNVHAMNADGFGIGDNLTLQDSYVHDFVPCSDCHSDGAQMVGGSRNVVIRHNSIDLRATNGNGVNSALFLAPDLGPSGTGPVIIDDNLLGGGNYTLCLLDGNHGQYHQTGYRVTSNRFVRDAQYGPTHINEPGIDVWSGNAWDDTGATVDR